jgi:hypothetical protein
VRFKKRIAAFETGFEAGDLGFELARLLCLPSDDDDGHDQSGDEHPEGKSAGSRRFRGAVRKARSEFFFISSIFELPGFVDQLEVADRRFGFG